MKQRRHDRSQVAIRIQFRLMIPSADDIEDLRLNGTIVDISPEGFALTTSYPLSEGHFITIVSPPGDQSPRYGIVRWSRREAGAILAGLSHTAY